MQQIGRRMHHNAASLSIAGMLLLGPVLLLAPVLAQPAMRAAQQYEGEGVSSGLDATASRKKESTFIESKQQRSTPEGDLTPSASSNNPSASTADYPLSGASTRMPVFEAVTPPRDKTGRQIPRAGSTR